MKKTKEPNENEIRRMAASRSYGNDEMMDPELIEDILIFAEMACREESERRTNMIKKIIADRCSSDRSCRNSSYYFCENRRKKQECKNSHLKKLRIFQGIT